MVTLIFKPQFTTIYRMGPKKYASDEDRIAAKAEQDKGRAATRVTLKSQFCRWKTLCIANHCSDEDTAKFLLDL